MSRVALLLASFLLCATLRAAELRGHVTDSTGAALPGVTVSVAKAKTTTDPTGAYALRVSEGAYDVTYSLEGFATITRRIGIERTARIDVTMQLAASTEVVVTAPAPVEAASAGVITASELQQQPVHRTGDVMEKVPGIVVTQHSGEGKANQYYLRGFDLDHGTDIAIDVAGVPVNLPSHAHGQGYADVNFVIPELITAVDFRKGPYFADAGDFASAGAIDIRYASSLEQPLASFDGGQFGYRRALTAGSQQTFGGDLLAAIELGTSNGPWLHPDDLRKVNALLRFTRGAFGITAMAYDSRWNSTDQIPDRAAMSRFGAIDPSDGGNTSRYALSADWQHADANAIVRANAYAVAYRLDLFSNFTYFLDDPVNGDQFEQVDHRVFAGGNVTRQWTAGRFENSAGVEARHDDIPTVALFHTRKRTRLDVERDDDVRQTSGGVWAQTAISWTSSLRTIAGLRADGYAFDVDRTGRRTASLVSPKLSVIAGPWRGTEFFANAGYGFHSNDARVTAVGIDPLVRTRGGETGVRTQQGRVRASAAVWVLDSASELVFSGDSGTTEPQRAGRRKGVDADVALRATPWMSIDGGVALSRSRYRNDDARIPGSPEAIASLGAVFENLGKISGDIRLRYFGSRPLTENDGVRSAASRLVTTRVAYALSPHAKLHIDVFNLLNAHVSDIDYVYTSRLPGEPVAGVSGIHSHPAEPRSFRAGITAVF